MPKGFGIYEICIKKFYKRSLFLYLLKILKFAILKLITVYRFFSKFTPSVCRFQPTCSKYTMDAIEKYGIFKGIFLGIKRILKCHPGHPGAMTPCLSAELNGS